jgi:ribonucleoside-triphosphate reductase
MHMSDAVLAGGVRRSATICIFSMDDIEMLQAKTGEWYYENPQRGRSNNSVALIRSKTTREDFNRIIESSKQFGEPGFVWLDDEDVLYNPCVEIGMLPQTIDGRSGWQGCNLTEINGAMCNTREDFLRACKASAVIGTLQASYTDFTYVAKESKEIFDYEALLGCSVTGWMNNPKVLFNEENQRDGATLILEINAIVAEIIGINPAARATCTKPSGNASVLLMTASGIHGEHDEKYLRVMQLNKGEEIADYLNDNYPNLLEESVWSANNSDYAVFFPVRSKKGSIYKKDLLGVKQLEYVKLVQTNWVEYGTRVERCSRPYIRHNVSNTITVDNWDEVEEYIWENRSVFAGISFMASKGDKVFPQSPFMSVINPTQILEKYGDASLFASGLIIDALHYFNNNLWQACDHVMNSKLTIDGTRESVLLRKDWIRRAKQFARRYFDNVEEMTFCLKDVHNYHKWIEVNRGIKNIDIASLNLKPKYVDAASLAAAACAGGSCELVSL